MSISEQHLDTKFEACEARTDTKFAQLMGEVRLVSVNVAHLATEIAEVKANQHTTDAKLEAVKAATATVKWNIVTLGLTLAGMIIAIFAFGFQIMDMAQALFTAGLNAK